MYGSMPEWLKGTDCKSVGIAYVGSNPTRPNIFQDIEGLFTLADKEASLFNPNICELLLPGATIG